MSQETSSEAELFVQAAGGDREAFEMLATKHRPLMEKIAQRRLGTNSRDGITPEDVVASALAELFTRIQGEAPRYQAHPFRAWAAYVVRHRCTDVLTSALKDAKRIQQIQSGKLNDQRLRNLVATVPFRDPDESDTDQLAQEETLERLRSLIDALNDEDRLLIHGWLDGRTQAQIAQELGIHPGTVSNRFRRACVSLYASFGSFSKWGPPGLGEYRRRVYVDRGQWKA